MTTRQDRPEGYYWIRRKMSDGRWLIAEWYKGEWLTIGRPAIKEDDVLVVGERIMEPGSKV